MSILQRTLKRFGYVPMASARSMARNFGAAMVNRLTADWGTGTLSADAQAQPSLEKLRARSRRLRDDNDYARKFISMLKTNVLGESGICLKMIAKDPDRVQGNKLVPGQSDLFANKLIEENWWQWGRKPYCTADGQSTFQDLETIALETWATDGEVLIRKLRGFNNPWSYSLEVLESDHLDLDMTKLLPGGGEIRMGVELDSWRRPVAYHLRKRNPNDLQFGGRDQIVRVPASDIIHLYLKYRPGQTRGIPLMQTAMKRLNMFGGYEEAELVAARTAASKMAFLKKNGSEYTGEPGGSGKVMDAEPGSIEELPDGMELQVMDWNHPSQAYQHFAKTCLRGVAAGLGCSYNVLADDMEAVNFSSGRLGLQEPRELYKMLQNWLATHLHQVIFEDWLLVQLMTGKLPLPAAKFSKFNAARWKGRRWPYIQPKDDAAAAIARIGSGLSTLTKELADQGIDDRDEHLDELAADKAAADARGLEFPDIFKTEPEPAMVQAEQPAAE